MLLLVCVSGDVGVRTCECDEERTSMSVGVTTRVRARTNSTFNKW